jgi:hypothetical protein
MSTAAQTTEQASPTVEPGMTSVVPMTAVPVTASPTAPAGSRGGSRPGKGLSVLKTAALTGAVRRASDHAAGELGSERLLPVLPELRALLPGRGLRRGATVAVATVTPHGASSRDASPRDVLSRDTGAPVERSPRSTRSVGATSLLLALLAAASGAGSWCAIVGVPTLDAVAAAEAGLALDRLALVPNPGPDWTTVVAALLDGVDIVVAAPPGPIAPSVAGRLAARARQRGSVLVSYGRWDGADITFDAVRAEWQGLGQGRGRLRCRQLTVMARGRGAASVPRRTEVWFPVLQRSWTRDAPAAPQGVQDPEEPMARAG